MLSFHMLLEIVPPSESLVTSRVLTLEYSLLVYCKIVLLHVGPIGVGPIAVDVHALVYAFLDPGSIGRRVGLLNGLELLLGPTRHIFFIYLLTLPLILTTRDTEGLLGRLFIGLL